MNQRGFLPIAAYIGLAALAVILAMGLALKVQGARLDAKAAELEACETRYAETLKLVEKQNKAVKDLSDEAQKRARSSAAALAKARQGQGSLNAKIKQLQASKADSCEKGVAAVKSSLKP